MESGKRNEHQTKPLSTLLWSRCSGLAVVTPAGLSPGVHKDVDRRNK